MAQTIGTAVVSSASASSVASSPSDANFHTENLELAAFLLARGHRLVGAISNGRLVSFEFVRSAVPDVANFFSGAVPLPPITLFEHHRTLRSLITTVRNSQGRVGGVA